MPQADIPFIVGVIREKEKGLLEDDEYTRVLEADSSQAAAQALSDTAYGMYLAQATSPLDAISDRLVDEFEWLVDVLGPDHPLITFISARFDALHVAAALIDVHDQSDRAKHARVLGTMTAELITSCLRENAGWESVPEAWRAFLQKEAERLDDSSWTKTDTIDRVKTHMLRVMLEHDNTELSHAIVSLMQTRLKEESRTRPNELPEDLIQFERDWDEQLLALLRPWKSNATEADAVLAWWYALALEARTLRLVLSAKLSGFSGDTLRALRRSLYQKWI